MKIKLKLLFLCIITLNITYTQAQDLTIAEEIRAVWLTTNWNLDWPQSGISAGAQKKQLCDILDKLKQANFNTILFQTRIRGDVFYQSEIEPWSPFFHKNNSNSSKASYDPLAFAIEECHKRGLECHAWFVTFPLGTPKQIKAHKNNSIVSLRPDLCKLHQGEWYLNPGNPEARHYLVRLVDEIVKKYDIDGIHFDYIRYPEAANKFPDKDTFRKYGNGQSLYEWRRNNITQLVSEIYNHVKITKPWVQVSSSPLGRYRSLDPSRGTWTAYESVHQDAALWMQLGIMDAVYPMLYYNEQKYEAYVQDWQKNSNNRFVSPGLGIYRMLSDEGNWTRQNIMDQIDLNRKNNTSGTAYYRAGNILNNTKGIYTELHDNYYMHPAKLPPMKWLDNVAPNSPFNMQVYRDKDGLITIEWESSNKTESQTHTLYTSDSEDINTQNGQNILATGIHGNRIQIQMPDTEQAIYFSLTSSDRFHNESVPCFPTFFILSSSLEK